MEVKFNSFVIRKFDLLQFMKNTLKKSELVRKLASISGACPVTFYTETIPKMNKNGNPYFGRVIKRSKVNGMIEFDYSNSVNNQRLRENKEADFQAKQRSWGQHITPTLIEYKGKLFVQIKIERTLDKPEYLYDNVPIQKEKLEPWLVKSNKPESQGTEKEIMLRDYNIDNIRELHLGGEFVIIDDVPSEQIAAQIIAESRAEQTKLIESGDKEELVKRQISRKV